MDRPAEDAPPPPRPAVSASARSTALLLGGWVVFSVVLAVGFIAWTGQVWEDFFITFKFSQNLAEGNGLTYDGETRVHGFTSVINTLLPALFYRLAGNSDWLWGLRGYQVVALLFLTGAIAFLLRRLLRRNARELAPALLLCLLLLLEIKVLAFAYNGQEAAFMVGFLALALAAAARGTARHWILAGCAWAGLMYTRPDSPVYIAILGLVVLAFPAPRQSRRDTLIGLLKAGGLCAVLYLPWFLFAWFYYGTPVPHTVMAKASGAGIAWDAVFNGWVNTFLRAFAPIYFNPADWPFWAPVLSVGLSVTAALYWLWPRGERLARMASLGFFLTAPYLAVLDASRAQFPWYFPPLVFLGLFATTRAIWLSGDPSRHRRLRFGLSAGLALAFALLFARAAYQVKYQQAYSESVRTQVGKWLNANAEPDEEVYLECLGYIGFFSQQPMLDWPGMASPEVVAAGAAVDYDFYRTMEVLDPHWLALRAHEYDYARAHTDIEAAYSPRVFINRRPDIINHQPPAWIAHEGKIPGIGWLLMDAAFIVLERQPAATP